MSLRPIFRSVLPGADLKGGAIGLDGHIGFVGLIPGFLRQERNGLLIGGGDFEPKLAERIRGCREIKSWE
jgi:hypothetical protein